MVDSNLQREHILPSEKAFAYKMKMEALDRKAGRPKNWDQVGPNFKGMRSAEIVGEKTGDSATQVKRYIRLTNLIPEILQMVDDGRIALTPAVELVGHNPQSIHKLIKENVLHGVKIGAVQYIPKTEFISYMASPKKLSTPRTEKYKELIKAFKYKQRREHENEQRRCKRKMESSDCID